MHIETSRVMLGHVLFENLVANIYFDNCKC